MYDLDWHLQVGKGLSKDEKAQKLALRHWLEAVSTRSQCHIDSLLLSLFLWAFSAVSRMKLTDTKLPHILTKLLPNRQLLSWNIILCLRD